MSSNRPETSIPQYSSTLSTEIEKSLPFIGETEAYVPRAGDLVIALPRISNATLLEIPASFLHSEAVDSSLLLGQGASFTVTRHPVPSGPKVLIDRIEIEKLMTLNMPFRTPKRPSYIVYKSPRVVFKPDGEPASPQDRRAFQSVLTELHALLHPPLLRHANIIDILGVAWGSNHATPTQRLPVLVVEYGDRGTLADVQLNRPPLSPDLKLQIALGIARGLQALHEEGIIHGDIKPENIIMCSHEEHVLVPKLGDFGFAIIEAAESLAVVLGGTRTWRAPESYSRIPVARLKYTDIYSFGLVAWSIALDGQNPFSLLLPEHLRNEDRFVSMDQMKSKDGVLTQSKFEAWVPVWKASKGKKTDPLSPGNKVGETKRHPLNEMLAKHLDHGIPSTRSENISCETLRQQKFFSSLEALFACTLPLQPEQRDLRLALEVLNKDAEVDISEDVAALELSEAQVKASQNMIVNIVGARSEVSRSPYSEVLADESLERSPTFQCPESIVLRLWPEKSAQETKVVAGSGVPLCVLQEPGKSDKNVDPGYWSTILFQMQYGETVKEGSHAGQPFTMFYQVPKGRGLGFTIPNRVERLPFRIHRFQNEDSQTWVFRFNHESGQPGNPYVPPGGRNANKINWAELGYKAEIFSWQNARDLDPAVQRFVAGTLLHRSDSSTQIVLGAFFMNGYGVQEDIDAALSRCVQAARQGHPAARAYLFRFFSACRRPIPADIPVLEYLVDTAVNGSRMALQDLASVDQERAGLIRSRIVHELAGVGAIWYQPGQWLDGISLAKFRDKGFEIESLGPPSSLSDVVVNHRGDHLIHAAAALCEYELVKRLLDDFHFDVNQQNLHGDTALLCACRSGHLRTAKLLLAHSADASIQANNGESPLHWLVSFSEQSVLEIGIGLMRSGKYASVDVCTNQNISHSSFPGNIDVDFQLPGTPLLWAVRNNRLDIVSSLLSNRADPQYRFRTPEYDGQSPLMWAAAMHHTKCLEFMITTLEYRIDATKEPPSSHFLYGPLVRNAIHGSDRFSMIIRNGQHYLSQLESTLRLLQEKTRGLHFNIPGKFDTVIGYAASEAHDEAVEILLNIGWGNEDINKPNNADGRTALLEAVRWNRSALFKLLVRHGADMFVTAANPFDEKLHNWTALHIFAEQAHDEELSIVEDLLQGGVPVDGRAEDDVETPLHVAIRRNAFKLADLLLSRGAVVNATSTRSSLLISSYPLTGLGHIIALNARHCFGSLRYLLSIRSGTPSGTVDFVVDPERGLTALHLSALVPHGLRYTTGHTLSLTDFDYETNRQIVHELLDWFSEAEHLERRCNIHGQTALHLAVEYGNVGIVEELVKAGADTQSQDERNETVMQIARRVHGENEGLLKRIVEWIE